jgi:hypothetical protein
MEKISFIPGGGQPHDSHSMKSARAAHTMLAAPE